MKEDKQGIVDLLLPLLRKTEFYNVISLEYREKQGLVYAEFAGGYTKVVDVAGKEGVNMILEVIRGIM